MNPYKNIKIILASKHSKEIAIKKPFEDILGCEIVAPNNYDTDQYGTFNGEIARSLSQYETLKTKAINAAEFYDYNYIISSEGSFAPHPSSFFINSNLEMLLFYDRSTNLFISEYILSTDTNIAEKTITNLDEYKEFLKNIEFPSHAVIVKINNTVVLKGLQSKETLDDIIIPKLVNKIEVKLETDMRAIFNPTRMKVINAVAIKLANRVANLCIKCKTPGFGKESFSGFLQCSICQAPTLIKKYREEACIMCDYSIKHLIDTDIEFADPKYCNFCNP
jgi:sulfur carrier protein ThiS